MTPQHPAAPETETDANGLTEAECNRLTNFLEFYTRGAESISGLIEEVAGIVAERVQAAEHEREVAHLTERKETYHEQWMLAERALADLRELHRQPTVLLNRSDLVLTYERSRALLASEPQP